MSKGIEYIRPGTMSFHTKTESVPAEGVAFADIDEEKLEKNEYFCPIQPGLRAKAPFQIPWKGWKIILRRMLKNLASDQTGLSAAGCAFYGTLSLVPIISALISLYGLAFDPYTVEPQLRTLRNLLPPAVYQLINNQITSLLEQPHSTLTLSLVISFLVTMWAASASTKSMISALNLANNEKEKRGFIHYQLMALFMTFGALMTATLTLAILVALPVFLKILPKIIPYYLWEELGMTVIENHADTIVHILGPALLSCFVLIIFSVMFRYGPSRRVAQWRWILPGALVSLGLWEIVSYLFSYYVSNFSSYNTTYGPLGAFAGIMMWFYVTAYVVLLGAELNAELELHVSSDTTAGPAKPIGERGAYVADHVACDVQVFEQPLR